MGLIDKIKNDVKKSGTNKGKLFFVRDGGKARIRFLTDADDGMEVTFHDSFDLGVNIPCRTHFGQDCEYCDTEGLRTRSLYCWSIWDYEAKEVKLFLFTLDNCNAAPIAVPSSPIGGATNTSLNSPVSSTR